MEERIINKLRRTKKLVRKIYKNIRRETDFNGESLVDSATLEILTNLSKIDENLTDIIYELLDNKNS